MIKYNKIIFVEFERRKSKKILYISTARIALLLQPPFIYQLTKGNL